MNKFERAKKKEYDVKTVIDNDDLIVRVTMPCAKHAEILDSSGKADGFVDYGDDIHIEIHKRITKVKWKALGFSVSTLDYDDLNEFIKDQMKAAVEYYVRQKKKEPKK